MKPNVLFIATALTCAALQAQAIGNLADVTVLDRESGATLPVHEYRGEYWVAGRPGGRYAISIRNRVGERILAVPAVDGVNVLSGQTAGWDQTGYVYSPWRQYEITGWRKSSSEVAAFEFSASAHSYAERTGRPLNVGVIGVALFREKPAEPVVQAPAYPRDRESGRDDARYGAPSPPTAAAAGRLAESSAGNAPAVPAPESRAATSKDSFAKAAPMPAPKLGTAHGSREASVVSSTRFERLQDQPNEVIRIRYDSRENLVALGVIRDPVARAPAPNAFPHSPPGTSYVPDPPRY